MNSKFPMNVEIDACIHTYIHTYIHMNTHRYIESYRDENTVADVCVCVYVNMKLMPGA